ncbi:RHS repeat-associated core domain-containing protein [Streptomyces tsukubensis]|uniref:RHS repeat-associated core domain-containing protein n=1 Tax=Streptomyces tsukubensis TaxID=83656 RepID=UPI00367E2B92
MVATLLSVVPAQAEPEAFKAPTPARTKPVKVSEVPRKKIEFKENDAKTSWRPSKTAWPRNAEQRVTVVPGATTARTAGTLPVTLTPRPTPATAKRSAATAATAAVGVSVRVHDKSTADRAGINGVVFTAGATQTSSPASVDVGLDYRGFAEVFGGSWGSRLRLVQLPTCALTSPEKKECRVQTPLPSTNDAGDGRVSAPVTIGGPVAARASGTASRPLVLAATAAATGGGGDFSSTPLAATGSWNAGGSSGDFGFSYPIEEPPVPGGLAPDIALGYSSQSVDGRMSGGNSQAGWIGDGWGYSPGSISRTYRPCADDPKGTAPKVQDNCWAGELLQVNLAGHSGDLIKDGSAWRITNDGSEKVEYLTNTVNGTHDNGHWKITAVDGTQYYFGLNRPLGWATGKTETNSAWTVPVYGPHAGDPCNKTSGFAASRCDQAWQWNLDYVVDRHGNAMTYYYSKETNYYGANNGTTGVAYTRGGTLNRIDYGFTHGNAYTGSAPARVLFESKERCFATTCNPLATHKANWPDVPYDLNCNSGATCANKSPSFWSTQRLDKIRTQVWGGTAYADVDSWQLKQSFPAVGDSSEPSLWLNSIQRTGHSETPAISLPATTFTAQALANRYNTGTGHPNFTRFRISGIVNESGSATSVNYSAPQCTPAVHPSANVSRCYPVYWTPPGSATPILDWFNKFVVTSVTENDTSGGAPGNVVAYTYLGNARWHYDDNELTKPKYRTWGQWRGYPRVQTRTGEENKTLTETLYYQGMDGDVMPGNTTRDASVTLLPGVTVPGATTTVPDREELTGQVRQSITYQRDGGPVSKAMVTDYWVGEPTATRTRPTPLDPVHARMVRTQAVHTTTALTSKSPTGWRTTRTESSYDKATGTLLFAQQYGDIERDDQVSCTTSTYAPPNATTHVRYLIAEVTTVAKPCGTGDFTTSNGMGAPTGVDRAADTVSSVRTYYDTPAPAANASWPPTLPTWPQAAPAKGNVTLLAEATGYENGAYTYRARAAEQFDSMGRTIAAWNAIGAKGTTEYTVANGLTTAVKTGNALNQFVTTTVDPKRGNTLTVVDANAAQTDVTQDALGRTTALWLPGRLKSAGKSANTTFTYQISPTTTSSVTTKSLNEDGSYRTSIQIFDSLLRPRQTQTEAASGGGRLLTEDRYDTHGRQYKRNEAYESTGIPSTTLYTAPDNLVPHQTVTTYDGEGRIALQQTQRLGVEMSRTATVYGGDRTTLIPPTGGTPITTVIDALGRTVAKHHYKTAPTVSGNQLVGGDYITTSFTFDRLGRQTAITDPENRVRSYAYDFLGRKASQTDPDTGTSTSTYYPDGQLKATTDAEGRSTAYGYDLLGRKTGQYKGTDTTGTRTASWTYDDPAVANSKGRLTASTRHVQDGTSTLDYVQAVTKLTPSGKPLTSAVTIPSKTGEEGLAGTYTYTSGYTPNTELLQFTRVPAAGGLAAETVGRTYNKFGMPNSVGSSSATLTRATDYDPYGRVMQTSLGTAGKEAIVTFDYDFHSGEVNRVTTDVSSQTGGRTDEVNYARDLVGNITRISNKRSGGTYVDTQCFQNNLLGQLAQAWTATDDCAATPSPTAPAPAQVGGPQPYWTAWEFDNVGNQTKKTDFAVGGAIAKQKTTTFTYGRPGGPDNTRLQPDTLTETSTVTEGTPGATGNTYTYDKAGNTVTRTVVDGTDTLSWDGEGELVGLKSTGLDKGTSYLYDADGNELIRSDPDGRKTLYLPSQELVLETGSSSTSATRYYELPGGQSAVRTSANDHSFVINNLQGTGQLSLDKNAANPTWRSFTPYGAPRDGQRPAAWPGTKGFIGGTDDQNTGLTLLGARHYDPALGRFVSADPVFTADDPRQMGGYAYAGNNPISQSDPSGLMTAGACATQTCYQQIMAAAASAAYSLASRVCATYACYQGIKNTSCHCDAPASYSGHKASGGTHGKKKQSFWGSVGSTIKKKVVEAPLRKIEDGANWVKKNKVAVTSFVVATTVGVGCVAGAAGAGVATGGAGLALMAGCGALAGAAAGAVETAMTPNADKSLAGYGKSMLVGATVGAATGAVGGPAVKLAAKAVKPIAAKIQAIFRKCNSFLAGTQVAMANGTTKAIDKVAIGDKVKATDPVTKATRPESVTATITTTSDKHYTTLTLRAADGTTATQKATSHHPYWEVGSRQWVNAGDLKPGAKLLSTAGSAAVTVTAVSTSDESHRTFDLTVSNLHTYYVLAGATPVLVHNCNVTAAARAEADAVSSVRPAKARPAVAEALELPSGQVYSSPSVRGTPPTLHPIVQDILDAIPVAERGVGHGSCGLAVCVSRALTDGHNPTGSSAAAVIVRGSRDNPMHGHPVGPCDSCVALEDAFDINFVTAR